MNQILVLICFAFPGGPGEECGIASFETTDLNQATVAENVNVFCTAARRALAADYPNAELTRCEKWTGEPLGSSET